MISSQIAQLAVILAVVFNSVDPTNAFRPQFSGARQCSSLSISWSSMDLPTSIALTEITLSLIPLESNAHHTPEPLMLSLPVGGVTANPGAVSIPSLPFPGGTQFFAQAYIPGAAGPTRRTVSSVLSVEHSSDASCLNIPAPVGDKRVKTFGKRQISVIGVGTQDANATPASSSGDSAPASTPTSTGAVPPINVIGVGQVPASGNTDAPANAAPLPSSSGPVPIVNIIGTGVISASSPASTDASTSTETSTETSTSTSGAFVPDFTTIVDVGADDQTTTECTSTWSTEAAQATTASTETTTECTSTWSTQESLPTVINVGNSESTSCTETETAEPTSTGYEYTSSDSSSGSSTSTASAQEAVVTYSSFDDMVNAANRLFHAWNPYKPAYTPST